MFWIYVKRNLATTNLDGAFYDEIIFFFHINTALKTKVSFLYFVIDKFTYKFYKKYQPKVQKSYSISLKTKKDGWGRGK